MSHIRTRCVNCNAQKADNAYYEPFCADCQATIQAVRREADEKQIGNALYNVMKEQALEARRMPLGMEAKRPSNSLFDRIDSSKLRARGL